MNALGFEQRLQQGVLVLAVAVAILHRFGGGVRLQAAHAERKTDVADISRDIIVKASRLLRGRSCAAGQFGGFLADTLIHHNAFALQLGVPIPDLSPVGERAHLDVRREIRLFKTAFAIARAVWNEVLNRPGIDSAITRLARFVLMLGTLQLDRARFGHIDLQLLLVNRHVFGERMFVPELVRRQRRSDAGDGVILKHVARLQARDRHVALSVIAVGGGLAENFGSEILGAGRGCLNHLPIRLPHAYIGNFERLRGRRVSEDQLP